MKVERGQVVGVLTAIAMVWLGAAGLFGDSGLFAWMRQRNERARVGEDTLRLARETHELERAIARLAEGGGLETVAREQFGLVRPNEVVYRFRRPPAVERP